MTPLTPRALLCLAALSPLLPAIPAAENAEPPQRPAEPATPGGAPAAVVPAADHPANAATGLSGDDATLRAQVLLARARFSPGEIDGKGGDNTRRALEAFQRSRDIPASGELDEATWRTLNADPAPVLVEYEVTATDVAGPFRGLPEDMMEKAGLDALGYETAEEALGERFHASPALLQQLNPGTRFVAGARIVVPHVSAAAPLPDVSTVVVDRSDSVVRLLDADGRVVAQFPASTGSEHDPLPLGEWTIRGVARDPTFHYNPELFWNADPEHAKATLPPGPNSPVGVAWVDLSKEHYGIHGTPVPAEVGKTSSNGCIRLTNWDVLVLASAVATGMPAVLQE